VLPRRSDLKRERSVLLGILALALVLRLGYAWTHPLRVPREDAIHYDDIAWNLARGRGFAMSDRHLLPGDRAPDGSPRPTARRPPLYPLFLALLYLLFGRNYAAVFAVQALLSTASCYLVYRIGSAFFPRGPAPLLAALLSALYLPFLRSTASLLTETLFILLVLWMFLHLARLLGGEAAPTGPKARTGLRARRAAWAGILAALAYLCRPTAVGFPVMAAALVLFSKQVAVERRERVKTAILHVAVFLAVASPWPIRNYLVFHAFVPSFTSAGYNLFLGTYPVAQGKANIPLERHPRWLREELEGKGEVEANRIYTRAALENLKRYPLSYPRLMAIKAVEAWFNVAPGHVWRPTPKSLLMNGPILLLALAGLLLLRPRWRGALLFLPVGYFKAFHMMVVSGPRYNLPSLPFAMLLASYGLVRLGESWLRGKVDRGGPAG